MNHIINFNDYENINEENRFIDKWSKFLLAGGIIFLLSGHIRNINDARNIYKIVNTEQCIPTNKELAIMDSIREKVIATIEKTKMFNRFGKQSIIDSMRTIKFFVADEIPSGGNPRGSFINLDAMPSWRRKIDNYFGRPGFSNFILIRKDILHRPDSAHIITHELYHYLNKLYNLSDIEIKLPILDKRVTKDKEYGCRKLAILMGIDYDSSQVYKKRVDMCYRDVIKEDSYYSSGIEMYARWMTFKQELLENGIITNINQKVTLDVITDSLNDKKNKDIGDLRILCLFLDLEKMGEME